MQGLAKKKGKMRRRAQHVFQGRSLSISSTCGSCFSIVKGVANSVEVQNEHPTQDRVDDGTKTVFSMLERVLFV